MDKLICKISYSVFLSVLFLIACTKEIPDPGVKLDENVCRLSKVEVEVTYASGDIQALENTLEYDSNNRVSKVTLTDSTGTLQLTSYFYNSSGQLSSIKRQYPDEKAGTYEVKLSFNYTNNRLEGYSTEYPPMDFNGYQTPARTTTTKIVYAANGKVEKIIEDDQQLTFAYQDNNVISVKEDEGDEVEYSGYDDKASAFAGVNTSLAHQIAGWTSIEQDYNYFSKNNASKIRSFTIDSKGTKLLDITRDIAYEYNSKSYPRTALFTIKDRGGTRLTMTFKVWYTYLNCQ